METERVPVETSEVAAGPAAGELAASPNAGAGIAPRSLSAANVLALQRAAGNSAVTRLLDAEQQRAETGENVLARQPKPKDDKADLEKRVAALEKKTTATEMDLRWRATLGKRLSGYRETIYALTAGFQTAMKNFDAAQTQQAQAEAMKDQVIGAIVNFGAAGLAQPLLTKGFGLVVTKNLDKWVELTENPAIQAVQGVVSVVQTGSSQKQANQASSGGEDPVVFLSSNLKAVEAQTGRIESAFATRATKTAAFKPEDWEKWDLAAEEAKYVQLLKDLDAIVLPDPGLLEDTNTLAIKLEIYYWAAWIKSNYVPGVKGLQVGSKLAARMKGIGIESLADVTFDTSSWIFMDHKPPPPEFEKRLAKFAAGWSQPLVKAKK